MRDAILRSGKIALSCVGIARRERAVAIMPMGRGLVVHTLHEERDLNDAGEVFDRLPEGKTDPRWSHWPHTANRAADRPLTMRPTLGTATRRGCRR